MYPQDTYTVQGVGPGGYKFGKDQVFYLGEPTEVCLDNVMQKPLF